MEVMASGQVSSDGHHVPVTARQRLLACPKVLQLSCPYQSSAAPP